VTQPMSGPMAPHTATGPQTAPAANWTCTGISWRGGQPALTLTDRAGGELSRPLRYGEPFGIQLDGPRRCIGVWRGAIRWCQFGSLIGADDRDAQCSACAAADPGRALARDAVVDHREFRLYLATFGGGSLKVGISAVDRGDERLLEQGALAYTWLGRGSHVAARAAETVLSAAGLAAERRQRTTKINGWWHRGGKAARRDVLRGVAAAARRLPTWPSGIRPEPDGGINHVVDHADMYGLDEIPNQLHDVDQLRDGAALAGRIRTVIGPELLLDHAAATDGGHPGERVLLISGRMLAGWPVTPVSAALLDSGISPGGYRTSAINNPMEDDDAAHQTALF
jgi:hypothetical protein